MVALLPTATAAALFSIFLGAALALYGTTVAVAVDLSNGQGLGSGGVLSHAGGSANTGSGNTAAVAEATLALFEAAEIPASVCTDQRPCLMGAGPHQCVSTHNAPPRAPRATPVARALTLGPTQQNQNYRGCM